MCKNNFAVKIVLGAKFSKFLMKFNKRTHQFPNSSSQGQIYIITFKLFLISIQIIYLYTFFWKIIILRLIYHWNLNFTNSSEKQTFSCKLLSELFWHGSRSGASPNISPFVAGCTFSLNIAITEDAVSKEGQNAWRIIFLCTAAEPRK